MILTACAGLSANCSRGFIIPSKSVTDSMTHEQKQQLVIDAEQFKSDCPTNKFISL